MFNIFEKPWGLFGAAIVGLVIIYIILLDRRFYWLSLAIFVCSVLLHLSIETSLLEFNRIISIASKVILPTAIAGFTILLFINIANLKERSAYIWLIPVFLCILAFASDWAVKTDMEKIKTVMNTGEKAFEQENLKELSTIISDNYKDSYHSDKKELLRHCGSYFSEPVFRSITKTFMQIEKRDKQAAVTIVVFITFDYEGFAFENYGVTTAKVAAKLSLEKEKDKKWRIYQAEIIEVNNQPATWHITGGV